MASEFASRPTSALHQLSLHRLARHAPLVTLLLTLGLPSAQAKVRLGDPLPAHPWTAQERELVVVYGAGCGDMGHLWDAALASGLPVRAVFAEGDFYRTAQAPVTPWRGADATRFARQLHVAQYPTILLVEGGRLMNLWEGTFAASEVPAGEAQARARAAARAAKDSVQARP
ncbi:penicillin-binding protein [Deinococcus sp. Marseille-Q6407]|uniref:penicillin-binding protein n=1 Tax=Deinococcus sp. Marseille-Q6407 TaxID=2969223 RepID=UPI0028FC18FD|nr:penicillin-binding protein [Deinococcus sp. Marseille-Q6407]